MVKVREFRGIGKSFVIKMTFMPTEKQDYENVKHWLETQKMPVEEVIHDE